MVARWVRDEIPATTSVTEEKGVITGNMKQRLGMITRAWATYNHWKDDKGEVNWYHHLENYGEAYVANRVECRLPPLTGEGLRETVAQWPRDKAGGTDGWEASMFKDLPTEAVELAGGAPHHRLRGTPSPHADAAPHPATAAGR